MHINTQTVTCHKAGAQYKIIMEWFIYKTFYIITSSMQHDSLQICYLDMSAADSSLAVIQHLAQYCNSSYDFKRFFRWIPK